MIAVWHFGVAFPQAVLSGFFVMSRAERIKARISAGSERKLIFSSSRR